jgi:hypothetical protein
MQRAVTGTKMTFLPFSEEILIRLGSQATPAAVDSEWPKLVPFEVGYLKVEIFTGDQWRPVA